MKNIVSYLLITLLPLSFFAQNNSIEVGKDERSWNIYTKSSTYKLKVDRNNIVQVVYYGNKLEPDRDVKDWEYWGNEIPVRGGFVNSKSILEVIFPDGVRDIELEYKKYEITDIGGYKTIKITQQDKYYPLEVNSFIRILPEYDFIEKWIEVRNLGKKGSIKIEKLSSGSIFLPDNAYELTHFSGIWGHEFTPQTTRLTQGTKTIEVKDFKSYGSSTFMIRPEKENDRYNGKVWFGTFTYSGNWRLDFDKSFYGKIQVTGGINFWDQEVYLKPLQSFTTPVMIYGYTEEGTNGVTQNLASYSREKLLPQTYRDKVRPVLYNSWYATAMDVNEEQQLALAREAKNMGVEMFVIDDGWFKGRIDEKSGLGDWTVDKNKFPNGLNSLIEKVNAMGLQFGLWIEPEMVNPNSDLYRAHPDWVFYFPNRTRHEGRNQLILNLAREDVYQYLYKSLNKVLKENNIKFIKWDMNRHMTDPGFASAPAEEQRAVRIKYVENLYRLVESLRKDFPEVWFENCSSGGGRIDLGMISRYDFNWVSDNTDPVDRIFIQDSYLTLFPANTMISWVTHEDWHKLNPSLEFKFDVCMAGVLGVGYDITKWNDAQKQVAKKKIEQYKEIREVIHKGKTYRIVSPFDENRSILQYVSVNQKEVVVFVYNLGEYPRQSVEENRRSKLTKLKGLLPDATYKIEDMNSTYTGKYLMEVGIYFPVGGAYNSHIYSIKAL
ncbi:alpha-galactosidase [Prevotella sp. 10(H)]|uniref:alpha-galactosidase n=1 Tax=Prevotella sp. 10(H) TaxID=1158294 RepID=UPI0004A6BDD2|nr:alpha-galactosidase [Prevotella sp. 10(H)]